MNKKQNELTCHALPLLDVTYTHKRQKQRTNDLPRWRGQICQDAQKIAKCPFKFGGGIAQSYYQAPKNIFFSLKRHR